MKDRDYTKEGAERAEELVEKLKGARRASRRWTTQDQFGRAVGVSGQTVSQTELGNVSPRLSLMCAWAAAFGFRLELVEIPGAEREEDPVEEPAAPVCAMCGGRRIVEARGETHAIVVDGEAFVACPSCGGR